MLRGGVYDNILEGSSMKGSTLEEIQEVTSQSLHSLLQMSPPTGEIELSTDMDGDQSNKRKIGGVPRVKSVKLKPRDKKRNLRSRRNLVDTPDMISDATIEVSVAPLIDDNEGQEVIPTNKAGPSTKVKRFAPRSRPQLLGSVNQSAMGNSTFDLSVASIAGEKNEISDQIHPAIRPKFTQTGNRRNLRSRKALVDSVDAGAENETTFEVSVISKVGKKLNKEVKRKVARRNRKKLVDSVSGGNNSTFEISVAAPLAKLEADQKAVEAISIGKEVPVAVIPPETLANTEPKNSLVDMSPPEIHTNRYVTRRTASNSRKSESIRTGTDVISATRTEVTRVSSTKLVIDPERSKEDISIDDTVPPASVMESTLSGDRTRRSIPPRSSKKRVNYRGRRRCGDISKSMMIIDFAGAAIQAAEAVSSPKSEAVFVSPSEGMVEFHDPMDGRSVMMISDATGLIKTGTGVVNSSSEQLETVQKRRDGMSGGAHDLKREMDSVGVAAQAMQLPDLQSNVSVGTISSERSEVEVYSSLGGIEKSQGLSGKSLSDPVVEMDVESVVQGLPLSGVDLDAHSEEPASKSNAVVEMASPSAESSSDGKSKDISGSKMNVDCSGVVAQAIQSSDVHQRVSADCDLLDMSENDAVHASERSERSQRRCQMVGDSGDNVDSVTEVDIVRIAAQSVYSPSTRHDVSANAVSPNKSRSEIINRSQEVEKCQSSSLTRTNSSNEDVVSMTIATSSVLNASRAVEIAAMSVPSSSRRAEIIHRAIPRGRAVSCEDIEVGHSDQHQISGASFCASEPAHSAVSAMECAPGAGEILAMSSPSPRSCAAVSIEVSSIEPVNSSAKMETVDDIEVGIQVSTAKLEMGASSSGCRSSRMSVEDIKESEKSSTPVNGSLLQTEWNISASLSGRRGSRMSVELPQTDSPQGTELPVDVDEQAVGSSPCLSESKDGTSEDDITPLPVSPRRDWPSPLRRSGSLGYSCPSIPGVPLRETKSRSGSSQSKLSRRTCASSSAGSQRRTISVEEMREIEMKLLDFSAEDVDVDQEANVFQAVPSIHMSDGLSLCASHLDVTAMEDMVLKSPLPLPPGGSNGKKSPEHQEEADDSVPLCQKEAAPSGSAPCGSKIRRSVQFAPRAEVLKQNPEGHWNRLAVPVGEAIDLSPIKPLPGRRRVFDDYGLSLEEDSVETSVAMVGSLDFGQKCEMQKTLACSSLTPAAVEALNSWKEGWNEGLRLSLEEGEEKGLAVLTERTYAGNLGGQQLNPEKVKTALDSLAETASDSVATSSLSNDRSRKRRGREVTCEIDPSMASQSQWLPPPDEGMEYDMEALSNALHYMLLGWVKPTDPIFIPLPRSAFQRRVKATPGLRRGSRIRIPTPRDRWDKVYYESRVDPESGLMVQIPLGYLRYPKSQEIRRRVRLLKMRKVVVNGEEKKAASKKRLREARLKQLAAKRRRMLCPSGENVVDSKPPIITLEPDVKWMGDNTKTLPIGHLINPKGPSEIPVVFDSCAEASAEIAGCTIGGLSECEIEPGLGLFHLGPLEVSIHDITNVVSAEQKRRGLHYDDRFSNLFILSLRNPDELDSVEPVLVVQIGIYAIPLKKAVSVLIPRGIPYKFVSITPNPVAAHRLRFVPKRP